MFSGDLDDIVSKGPGKSPGQHHNTSTHFMIRGRACNGQSDRFRRDTPRRSTVRQKGEPESVRTSGQHYDQVQFSSHLSETEKRIKETSGQLVQQIRTRPSRQELDALRQQIADGTYQADAREIAARMLLMEEY